MVARWRHSWALLGRNHGRLSYKLLCVGQNKQKVTGDVQTLVKP